MRAPIRLRWLPPLLLLPCGAVALGLGLQAAAFPRPPAESLVAVSALRELLRYQVMRASEDVGGRRMSSVCVQALFRSTRRHHLERGALVLFGNGERLYDVGHGVRRVGLRQRAGPVDRTRFLLAGCPQFLGERISARLLRNAAFDADAAVADGVGAHAIVFGTRRAPIDLYAEFRTLRPVELMVGGPAAGVSDLEPGAGRRAIVRVRRAFGVRAGRRPLHA